jgi:hypothetical protein
MSWRRRRHGSDALQPSAVVQPAFSHVEQVDALIVRGCRALQVLLGYLFLPSRGQLMVAMVCSLQGSRPLFDLRTARAVLGSEPRIYCIQDDVLLRRLARLRGPLVLMPGIAPIWSCCISLIQLRGMRLGSSDANIGKPTTGLRDLEERRRQSDTASKTHRITVGRASPLRRPRDAATVEA